MAGYAKAIALAAVAVSSAIIVSIFAIPSLNSPAVTDAGGTDTRRIMAIVYERGSDLPSFRHVKLSDSIMGVNSMQWTVDPFGRSMSAFYDAGINRSAIAEEKNAWVADTDAQERYMLVRLPEWLGGAEEDISAFRAFSAFDIASHCTIRYWGSDRMIIQDPCHSNGYRPWDGLTMHGVSTYGGSGGAGILFSSAILALPQMRLGVDSEGYVVAHRPDNSLYGDGVVGEGKRFASEQLQESNEKLIQAASRHAGFELPFPATVSGKHLVWMVSGENSEFANGLFFIGHSFEDHEWLFSAIYQPRPVPTSSNPNYRITIFNETFADASPKTMFDDLFGTESPECDQSCRFMVQRGDNMIARVDTEAGAEDLNAEALVWGTAGDRNVMVTIEGINSGMDELVQIASSLDLDYDL